MNYSHIDQKFSPRREETEQYISPILSVINQDNNKKTYKSDSHEDMSNNEIEQIIIYINSE